MKEVFSPGKYSREHCISRLYERAFQIKKNGFPEIDEKTLETLRALSKAYRSTHDREMRHMLVERIDDIVETNGMKESFDRVAEMIHAFLISRELFFS